MLITKLYRYVYVWYNNCNSNQTNVYDINVTLSMPVHV